MGIQGLLPLLKSIQKSTHLRNFAGQTLGVDAYGWLHRGTVSCAIELAQQKPTRKHIDFALSRVRMLIHFGVKPYLVFDGDYLPSKAHTEKERAARRKESKKLGLELLAMGRISQAYLELQKAIDVTPSMARELIDELKKLDVPYVVAPYEADSQLAYLEKQGHISGVLSEDSDLLVFGVKCLLTKLDQYGECVMINRADFTACREVSLVGWTDKEFRIMAMLSGCDYLPGIESMGLKTAYRLVRKHKVIDRVVRTVQFDGKKKVPAGYLEAFDKAEKTFLYQWVFCPEARCLLNLNQIPAELDIETMPYLGRQVDPNIAAGVADGELDPNTKERIIVTNRLHHPASRSRPAQVSDEKQGKPISEFFKPKRTPLAELDPNSFTPSPSQQRLLENQRGASWSASQVQGVRPTALNRVDTTDGPSSAPQATGRAVSNQWPDMQRKSPKRQRLCSDSALAVSMDGAVGMQAATSRFFAKQTVQPSPSVRKASNRKKDEFELWSDDSAADAIAELTGTPDALAVSQTPSPKKKKKLQVFADSENPVHDAEGEDRTTSADTSHNTAGTTATLDSAESPVFETPTMSFESDKSKSERTVFSQGIDASFAALKAKYSFISSSPRKGVSRTHSAPLARRSVLGSKDRNCFDNEALNQRYEIQKPPAVSSVVPSSPPLLYQTTGPDEIHDEEWLAMEQKHANQVENLRFQGSEDLLIPESPESAGRDEARKPVMDLGQFAFAG